MAVHLKMRRLVFRVEVLESEIVGTIMRSTFSASVVGLAWCWIFGYGPRLGVCWLNVIVCLNNTDVQCANVWSECYIIFFRDDMPFLEDAIEKHCCAPLRTGVQEWTVLCEMQTGCVRSFWSILTDVAVVCRISRDGKAVTARHLGLNGVVVVGDRRSHKSPKGNR